MKIGIIGSRVYENRRKIKETIYKLRQKFNEDLIIVSKELSLLKKVVKLVI